MKSTIYIVTDVYPVVLAIFICFRVLAFVS